MSKRLVFFNEGEEGVTKSCPPASPQDEWQKYERDVKPILREMASSFLITLYVGADIPQNDFEEIFQQELENELTNRGVRGQENAEPKGYWPLNDLDDEEVDVLGMYFEGILPNYLQRWVEGIEAVKAHRQKKVTR